MKKTKEEIFRAVQEDLKSNHYLIPEDFMLEAMEEYKDQELEELQAKYEAECQKSKALYENSQSQHQTFNAMYKKYEKLKEAFDLAIIEIGSLNKSAPGTVSKWYKQAGLTE